MLEATKELPLGGEDSVARKKSLDQWMLRVRVSSPSGDHVQINLPMSVVKLAMDQGVDLSAVISSGEMLKELDLARIIRLVEQGAGGSLVQVESANGDKVEVVVE